MREEVFYFVIISWFSFNACEGQRHLVCKEMEDIFTTEPSPRPHVPRRAGIPGKRGVQGEKGETGETGPQGPPAVVDYGRIETEVLERISSDITALETKIDGLTSRIVGMDERLLVIEKQSELCDVTYNRKCFIAILHSTHNVNHAQAEELCSNIGWKLANIYDPAHYRLIADYLRTKISSAQIFVGAWLGMSYNQQTQTTLYSDGNTANVDGIKWYPGYPQSTSSFTQMCIVIKKNHAVTNQGILNYPTSYPRHGSLCEL